MKHLLIALMLAAVTLPATPNIVEAGTLRRACLKSDRQAASRRMCRCMQQVADRKLRRSDQKLAASFSKTPTKRRKSANLIVWGMNGSGNAIRNSASHSRRPVAI